MGAAPTSDSTFVVILGASEYPHDLKLSNKRFLSSATAIKEYFESPNGQQLASDHILWLFDSPEAPSILDARIRDFLRLERNGQRPRDVIVYYVGHGFFDEQKAYFLALQSLRPDAPDSSYRFRALQLAVKTEARHARKYLILDACFSGAANHELMGVNAETQLVLNEVAEGSKDDLANSGTALLCAASREDTAVAPESAAFTMFSGALLEVLGRGADEPLSLRQVRDLTYDVIRTRYPNDAVRPEVHSPDQRQGDVAGIPLFRSSEPVASGGPGTSARAEAIHDAMNPATFLSNSAIHCVVVSPELAPNEDEVPLVEHVRRAWEHSSSKISAEANRYRQGRRLPPVPAPDSPDPAFVLAELSVQRAFQSTDSLISAIQALCKAELAVFDLTDFQPGVLILLGIRAVARRGVTVSSLGGKFTIGAQLAIPFNLQLLNLAAHSQEQEREGNGLRPWDLLGDKIANGYGELADLPDYLDLPAYDAVRQLGVEASSYRPIRYDEKVLMLCPFSPEYTARNWKRFLAAELPGKLMQRIQKAGRVVAGPPRLERLLELKTPRLVAQTLFESIRLIDMCIIDWTGLRANVMFEAGVRLATNPLAAVHIIEAGGAKPGTTPIALSHVTAMMKVFKPIAYQCKVGDTVPYEEMVAQFEANLKHGRPNFAYTAVGTALDRRSQPAAPSLVDELTRSANLLVGDDEESTGVSPVLFHEVNKELVLEAYEAAAERRLAAWLFLTRRYSPEDIASDPQWLKHFALLSVQVRRWARKQGRKDVIDEVTQAQLAVNGAKAGGEVTREPIQR